MCKNLACYSIGKGMGWWGLTECGARCRASKRARREAVITAPSYVLQGLRVSEEMWLREPSASLRQTGCKRRDAQGAHRLGEVYT